MPFHSRCGCWELSFSVPKQDEGPIPQRSPTCWEMSCGDCLQGLPSPTHTQTHSCTHYTLWYLDWGHLGYISLLINTTSWAIPVTDREWQHNKNENMMLTSEEGHTKLLRVPTALLLLSADGNPCASLSTFCGYRDSRVTWVTPFFPFPYVD